MFGNVSLVWMCSVARVPCTVSVPPSAYACAFVEFGVIRTSEDFVILVYRLEQLNSPA